MRATGIRVKTAALCICNAAASGPEAARRVPLLASGAGSNSPAAPSLGRARTFTALTAALIALPHASMQSFKVCPMKVTALVSWANMNDVPRPGHLHALLTDSMLQL